MKRLLFCMLYTAFAASAQLDQYQVYIGVAGFAQDAAYDVRGIDNNAFANYKSSPLVGVGFSMYLSDHIRLATNIEGTSTSKPNYQMSFASLKPSLNLHILPFDKVISPYIGVHANLAMLNLRQDPYTYIAYPQPVYSRPNPSNPLIVQEEISRPYFNLQSQPIFGAGIAVGVDVKLKKHWGLVAVLDYNALLDESNGVINKNLNNNNYNLSYSSLVLQLRYRLF